MLQFKNILPVVMVGLCLGIAYEELALNWDILAMGAVIGMIISAGMIGKRAMISWLICGLAFWGGYALNSSRQHEVSPDTIDYYVSVVEGVNLQGYVSEYADERNGHTLLTVEAKSVQIENEWVDVNGKVLITTQNYPEYQLGDWIGAKCVLQTPTSFEDFDYRAYLAKNEIYTTCYYPKVSGIDGESLDGWENVRMSILGKLNNIRQNFLYGVGRVFPEPSGGFFDGILIGARHNIPDEIEENFRDSGISHILAISGMHVAILIAFMLFTLSWAPRPVRFSIIAAFLLSFALMIGASASVIRASIMGILALFSLTTLRKGTRLSTLSLTGILMLIINPKLLIYDVGFQLSFLAIGGIILFYEDILKHLQKISKTKFIWEILAVTLSAQIMTIPVVAWNFENVSIVSPITNLLILPILPVLMLSGFIGGILGIFSIFWGKVAGFVGWIVAQYFFWVTNTLTQIPYSHMDVEMKDIWWIFGYYFVLGGVVLYLRKIGSLVKTDEGGGDDKK